MDALVEAINILNRLAHEAENLPDILAPVFSKESIVKVLIHNHAYSFKVSTSEPDWYILHPKNSTLAEVVKKAERFEIQRALRDQSSLRVIAIRRFRESSWLVFPFNKSDAESRGFNLEPKVCHLVTQNLQPFVTLGARLWGSDLVFDPGRLRPAPKELLSSLSAREKTMPVVKGLPSEFRIVYNLLTEEIKRSELASVEGKLRDSVEFLGGTLIGYSESGESYIVRWQANDRTFETRVSRDLRLQSAGMCLDGGERLQTLTSSVGIQQGFVKGRDPYDDDYDW